jgi:hypothetical protein
MSSAASRSAAQRPAAAPAPASAPAAAAAPAPGRRRLLSLAAPLALGFIPWRGCSECGFYDTGISDGRCQRVYQPAAAAEARCVAAASGGCEAASSCAPVLSVPRYHC